MKQEQIWVKKQREQMDEEIILEMGEEAREENAKWWFPIYQKLNYGSSSPTILHGEQHLSFIVVDGEEGQGRRRGCKLKIPNQGRFGEEGEEELETFLQERKGAPSLAAASEEEGGEDPQSKEVW